MVLDRDTWYVEAYSEQQEKWYRITAGSPASFGPWPLQHAMYFMTDDYKRWKNQYSQYHLRLRNADTKEVIPLEAVG